MPRRCPSPAINIGATAPSACLLPVARCRLEWVAVDQGIRISSSLTLVSSSRSSCAGDELGHKLFLLCSRWRQLINEASDLCGEFYMPLADEDVTHGAPSAFDLMSRPNELGFARLNSQIACEQFRRDRLRALAGVRRSAATLGPIDSVWLAGPAVAPNRTFGGVRCDGLLA